MLNIDSTNQLVSSLLIVKIAFCVNISVYIIQQGNVFTPNLIFLHRLEQVGVGLQGCVSNWCHQKFSGQG